MENIAHLLPDLDNLARENNARSLLFSFTFKGLQVRGVYFNQTHTITVAFANENLGWQSYVSEQGLLSESIPNEVYKVISRVMKDSSGAYTNKPFFAALIRSLERLIADKEATALSDAEIRALLAVCKTGDNKYDEHGDRPFFDHWRRVPASKLGLAKIARVFGFAVRQECYRFGVTGVWSEQPKMDSLLFLDPAEAMRRVQEQV
jgi:hypothetical protein